MPTVLERILPLLDELSPQETSELLTALESKIEPDAGTKGKVDWNRFKGVLRPGPDAVQLQRAWREEFD